jgi:hypothetical protein
MDAITHYSPFFKTAFTNGQYTEAETKVMKLEDIDEKVFGLFNQWLYTQELYTQDILHANADAAKPKLMELAKLWTAAAKWEIPSLQNKVMAELVKLIINEPQPPTKAKDDILQQFLIHAYSTKEDTALKKLAVHKMIRVLPAVVAPKEWIKEFPDGMMEDFAEALMEYHNSLPLSLKHPKFRSEHYMVKVNDPNA